MNPRFRATATAVLLSAGLVAASDAPTRPQAALGRLKAGNDRFASNASAPVALSVNRRQEVADAQQPAAMVLSCADSQVPPEHVFNAGLGELLVVRTAGGVIDRSVLATLEYGADRLHVPLLVVMGHEACDVVRAAADHPGDHESTNLDFVMKAIQASRHQGTSAGERSEIRALVLANVEQVINDALSKSPMLRKMVDAGQLQVVGAYYEAVSGRVIFSEPVAHAAVPQGTVSAVARDPGRH
jgi:carbonic anhydrase